MSVAIPLERMTPEEIARLKLRYTNRNGSAEVLTSKAWAHVQLQDAEIARLRAEVERLKALTEWRPFDTAPQDGTEIIVYREDALVFTASFCESRSEEPANEHDRQWFGESTDEDGWCWFSACGDDLTGDLPTLWMPMPAPPLTQEKIDGCG